MEMLFKFSLSSNFRQLPFLFMGNQSIESTHKLLFTAYKLFFFFYFPLIVNYTVIFLCLGEQNVWETMPDMNQKRTAPCSVSVNGLLYVMGGRQFFVRLDMFSCNETINSMECFDPILNRWYELPALPTPRCEAGAVVL